jgi:hypothetical protein
VGADRKGPLAAFVVIAIIAAVLLVTSVRSQADPGDVQQQRLTASASADPGSPRIFGAPAGSGSAGRTDPVGRAPSSVSRGAARDTAAARGGHHPWHRWLAHLWAGPRA